MASSFRRNDTAANALNRIDQSFSDPAEKEYVRERMKVATTILRSLAERGKKLVFFRGDGNKGAAELYAGYFGKALGIGSVTAYGDPAAPTTDRNVVYVLIDTRSRPLFVGSNERSGHRQGQGQGIDWTVRVDHPNAEVVVIRILDGTWSWLAPGQLQHFGNPVDVAAHRGHMQSLRNRLATLEREFANRNQSRQLVLYAGARRTGSGSMSGSRSRSRSSSNEAAPMNIDRDGASNEAVRQWADQRLTCLTRSGSGFSIGGHAMRSLGKSWKTRGDPDRWVFEVLPNRGVGHPLMASVRAAAGYYDELQHLQRVGQYGLPNFPTLVKALLCKAIPKRACTAAGPECPPPFVKNGSYGIILTDRTARDVTLGAWFRKSHPAREYVCVLVQALVALGMMHMDGAQHGRVTSETVIVRDTVRETVLVYRVAGRNLEVRTRFLVILSNFGHVSGARTPQCDVLHLLAAFVKPRDRVLLTQTAKRYPPEPIQELARKLSRIARADRCTAKAILASIDMTQVYGRGDLGVVEKVTNLNDQTYPCLAPTAAKHPWIRTLLNAWDDRNAWGVPGEASKCALANDDDDADDGGARGVWIPSAYKNMTGDQMRRVLMLARPKSKKRTTVWNLIDKIAKK